MDVILHLGAHRTGSTTFQCYMRGADARLAGQGIGFWGPRRTRDGLLHDLIVPSARRGAAQRATGRLRLARTTSERRGLQALVISDENVIGTMRACLRRRRLYPEAGPRGARLAAGLRPVRRAVLSIRSPEYWWASALAHLLGRGVPVPEARLIDEILAPERSWRQVVAEVARALPEAELIVVPAERFAPRPDALLRIATQAQAVPMLPPGGIRANRSPDLPALRALLTELGEHPAQLPPGEGRWMPFTPAQAAQLRERYADDLFWLRAGANGLARLEEDPEPLTDRLTWPPVLKERGRDDDSQEGRLAQTR
ncbi:hypothetical protein Salmuc_01124 [Salipiger mucosus DSM 16094]|uniref:Sulfotransferase family protein n=2 Tax=Salipiger mucosus TaxID=263378 RepID=S9QZR4_9RHOB|nr:hypothetical protein Salmuc_01124 [Salipiger mucosus DSM 16094]